jgi:hypothetical protein
MKPETKTEDVNSNKKDSETETLETSDDLKPNDDLKKPEEKEDNTRFGDWVIKGRTIDF